MSPEEIGAAAWTVIALQIATAGVAGLACLRAARRGSDARRGWRLIAVFAFAWAVGAAVWVAELTGAVPAQTYPTPADLIFLLGSVPLLLGVIAFPTPTSPLLSRRRLILDVVVLTATVTVTKWMLVLQGSELVTVAGPADPFYALGWIIFDAVIIAVALLHGMRERIGRRLAWGVLASALIVISVANSFYYRLLATDGYQPGALIDWGYVAAYVLITVAAVLWPPPEELPAASTPSLTPSQEAVPYAALAIAFAVAAVVRPPLEGMVVALWVIVGLAAFARRGFLLIDHVRVTNELQRSVAQQTAVASLAQTAAAGADHSALPRLLHRACALVVDALGVPLAKVDEVQEGGDLLVVAGVGWDPGVVGEARIPGSHSWRSGYALQQMRPTTNRDAPDGSEFALVPALARHGVVDGVSVPIGGRTAPYGVISVHTRAPREFEPDELEFLQFVADVIGTAVERSEADRQRAAVEEKLQQLTARLQAAVRMYSLALESGGMGVWEYDVVADRITPSRKVAEFYGTRVTTGSRTFAAAVADVHPDDQERVQAVFDAALERGQRFTCEYRFVRPDGAVMWVQNHARVERDEHGRARRVYGVTADVTERKRSEEELQLRDRHLRQAQKMESLGQLAGGVAHDFNNLLTAILGNTELLEARLAPSAPSELHEVRAAAQRAKGLVQQLLAFSRLQPHTRAILDVSAVLTDLSDLLVRLIGSHIDVRVTTAPVPAWVGADRVQLQQVVLNLATNARDSMAAGGMLELRTEVDEDAGVVRLVVRDSGTGMSPEVLARVFEPFYTTKPEGKGTGMGLAVVYGVVVQNEGDVQVTSEPGEGTTVTVELPYVPEGPPPQARDDEMPRVELDDLRGPAEEAPVILAVEDQPQIRSLITTVLEGRGHHVQSAGDGVEALEVAAGLKRHLDILITDVVMPRLNGPELASRLRAEQPDLKVLFISGYTRDVVLDSSQPGSAFLQKPFSISELVEVVEGLLGDDPVVLPGNGAGAPRRPA